MDLFKKIILKSSIDAGREITILQEMSQSKDHIYPLSFPQGKYLKGLLLRII